MTTPFSSVHLPLTFPMAEKPMLKIGFIPLLDCIPLVIAKELAFFAEAGLDVSLSREASWASIRDKVQFGLLDAAQMPAGIVLASGMGLGASQPMVTAIGLGQNGNAITASNPLYDALNPQNLSMNSESAATALKSYLKTSDSELTIASVHTYSTHHFLLRDWLNHYNIDPENKIRQIVVPPPQMVDAMERGMIDLFCAGEPWNSIAQIHQVGHKLLSGHQIWENAPDKVLGVTKEWHNHHPYTHQRLISAILKACLWLDDEKNKRLGFQLLHDSHYMDVDLGNINLMLGKHRFSPPSATFPWLSQASWFTRHIRNLHQLPDTETSAGNTYLTGVYRKVAELMKLNTPSADAKAEGIHSESWVINGTQELIEMPPDMRFR